MRIILQKLYKNLSGTRKFRRNYIKINGNIWKYGRILNSIPERASKDIKRRQKGSKRLKKPIKFQGKCKKSGRNTELQDEKIF